MNALQPLCQAILRLALAVAILAGGTASAAAQQYLDLLHFTNVWKYNQSGADLGTAWRSYEYDDGAWPSGAGLLGAETIPEVYPIPFNTHLDIFLPDGSTQAITFYFRTHFPFPTNAALEGVALTASNLLDDGCVIFLNGLEAGRVRIPTNQVYQTFASSGPPIEGAFETVKLDSRWLRAGDNVLAVEVHQAAPNSPDIALGVHLTAALSEPLIITNQPTGRTNYAGEAVAFTVGVKGGPVAFQWRKDGVALTTATNATLLLPNSQPAQSGDYTVVVSNLLGSVTSTVARLVVAGDILGPKLISARVSAETNIIVTFSEAIQTSTASDTNNFVVGRLETTNTVPVFRAAVSQSSVRLTVGGSNWISGADYYLTVNRVQDGHGNAIAPGSSIAVQWPFDMELVAADAEWSFHAAAAFEPDIYNQPWWSTNYVEGAWWSSGRGLFDGGLVAITSCLGPFQTVTGYQPEPTLFRTTFMWPPDLGNSALLRFDRFVDDSTVVFLNGREILRYNIGPGPGAPTASTRSLANVAPAFCQTNSVTVSNLYAGTNWLAVAVCDSTANDGQMLFGLRLGASGFRPGILPEDCTAPCPFLSMDFLDEAKLRLSWQGGGYTLEYATNLDGGTGSFPLGPWQPVTNLSNPYTTPISGPQSFFRLRKY